MPAETEASLRRDQVRDALMRDRSRALRSRSRAFRQYDAADPLNRLVTGQLGTRCGTRALAPMSRRLKGRSPLMMGPCRTPRSRRSHLPPWPAISSPCWSAPNDRRAAQKAHCPRRVMREVVADIDAEAAEIILVIHWMGGIHTELRLPRRRRGSATAPRRTSSPPSATSC